MRVAEGRETEPTAGIINSQLVKTTKVGGPCGYDAGKKVKGRKRHIATHTSGSLLDTLILPADIQDRDAAPGLIGNVGLSQAHVSPISTRTAETKRRSALVVGEDADLYGAALEFLLDGALDGVGRAQASPVMLRQGEDGEAFEDGALQPRRHGGGCVAIGGDKFVERNLSLGKCGGIPDAAQFSADPSADGDIGRVVNGIGGQMKLAALPRGGAKDSPAGGTQASVIVGYDELNAVHAARDQAVEEAAPMNLGLRQRDADTEHPAALVGADADRGQGGCAHLLVPGVEDQVTDVTERAVAPRLQLLIEQDRGTADLCRGEAFDAELAQHRLGLAGRDALHVHLGHRQHDPAHRAAAALKRLRKEGFAPMTRGFRYGEATNRVADNNVRIKACADRAGRFAD